MRLFPFVWMIVTIILGFAVLVTTWLDAMVQMSWFDDSRFSFPDGLAVWPDPILTGIGAVLIIGGFIATAVVVDRLRKPYDGHASSQVPSRGWPRIWMISTIGLGIAVFVMTMLETVAFNSFYNKHAILDGVPFGPRVILDGLAVVLTFGGVIASLVPQRRPRAGSLVIESLTA